MTKRMKTAALLCALALASTASAGSFLSDDPELRSGAAAMATQATEDTIFVGDMMFDRENLALRGFSATKWPNGILPIEFSANVTKANQKKFYAACAEWTAVANVRCIPRTTEADRIEVSSGTGNSAHVGKIGGKQSIIIKSWDWKFIIAHEIGHSLGLSHEQQRPDRASYINVIEANIREGAKSNFMVLPMKTHTPYDYGSVMHYGATVFGKPHPSTGLAMTTIEIVPKYAEHSKWLGQRQFLSPGDKLGMASQYGAPMASDGIGPTGGGNRSSVGLETSMGLDPATQGIDFYRPYERNQEAMQQAGIPKVFNGEEVESARLHDVVRIVSNFNEFISCTGTLIAPDRVLTARHCAQGGAADRVLVGTAAPWISEHRVDGAAITVGAYSDPIPWPGNPDIAVLRLETPVDGVKPRAIASQAEIDDAKFFKVVGFGSTDTNVFGIKHEASVPSATNDCQQAIADWNTTEAAYFGCQPGEEIVAGAVGLGTDTCNGDSGGALFVLPEGASGDAELKLAGVTSRAVRNGSFQGFFQCGDGGVYVRMTEQNTQFALGGH